MTLQLEPPDFNIIQTLTGVEEDLRLRGRSLHALGERKLGAPVDRVGLAPHVDPPGVRSRLAPASGLLLASEGAADLGPRGAEIDVGDDRNRCPGETGTSPPSSGNRGEDRLTTGPGARRSALAIASSRSNPPRRRRGSGQRSRPETDSVHVLADWPAPASARRSGPAFDLDAVSTREDLTTLRFRLILERLSSWCLTRLPQIDQRTHQGPFVQGIADPNLPVGLDQPTRSNVGGDRLLVQRSAGACVVQRWPAVPTAPNNSSAQRQLRGRRRPSRSRRCCRPARASERPKTLADDRRADAAAHATGARGGDQWQTAVGWSIAARRPRPLRGR